MTVGADDPRCAWQRFAQMLHTDGTAEGGDGAQYVRAMGIGHVCVRRGTVFLFLRM